MQCELLEERLNRLLDRRLHWSHDPVIASHCAHCAACRTLAETYATVSLVCLSSLTPPSLSPNFKERVLSAIVEENNLREVASRPTSQALSGNRLPLFRS